MVTNIISSSLVVQSFAFCDELNYRISVKMNTDDKYIFNFNTVVAADELYKKIRNGGCSGKFDIERNFMTVTVRALEDNAMLGITFLSKKEKDNIVESIKNQQKQFKQDKNQNTELNI